jgi:hypothetical protein
MSKLVDPRRGVEREGEREMKREGRSESKRIGGGGKSSTPQTGIEPGYIRVMYRPELNVRTDRANEEHRTQKVERETAHKGNTGMSECRHEAQRRSHTK